MPAVEALREAYASGGRWWPRSLPTSFLRRAWRDAVQAAGEARRVWEAATLLALRDRLRAGDVWVEGSRQWRAVEDQLIPPALLPRFFRSLLGRVRPGRVGRPRAQHARGGTAMPTRPPPQPIAPPGAATPDRTAAPASAAWPPDPVAAPLVDALGVAREAEARAGRLAEAARARAAPALHPAPDARRGAGARKG